MKKKSIIMALVLCVPALLAPLQALAATIESVSEIALAEAQNEFSLSLAVDQAEAYAGAEFALACGDGVVVKSVSYTEDVMSAGPTDARGFTWFSFFSDENKYSGTVTADVRLAYEGEADAYVAVDHVKVYTIDGGSVVTAKNDVQKTIPVIRQAAVAAEEEIAPQESAAPESVPIPDAGVPASASPERDADTTEIADAPRAASPADAIDIYEESTPASDIQAAADNRLNIVILMLLIISLAANLLLGYFNIKRHKGL
jgi:hypothetical protein